VNIRWFRRAEADLDALFSYVARDSLAIAESEVKRVTDAVAGLMKHPELGRPGRVAGTRELVVKPYIVAYRVKLSAIQILRVLHSARAWPKLL
jgi:toxin ParE1/3/4